ncbi:hypothetical protein EON80_28245, partial [bacterium]
MKLPILAFIIFISSLRFAQAFDDTKIPNPYTAATNFMSRESYLRQLHFRKTGVWLPCEELLPHPNSLRTDFIPATNFMSKDGYLLWLYFKKTGVWLDRYESWVNLDPQKTEPQALQELARAIQEFPYSRIFHITYGPTATDYFYDRLKGQLNKPIYDHNGEGDIIGVFEHENKFATDQDILR